MLRIFRIPASFFAVIACFAAAPRADAAFDELAELTPSAYSSNMGDQVAIAGDVVLATAPEFGSNQGRVYVFVKPPSGWTSSSTENATLVPSDSAADDRFGSDIAANGDVIVVAAQSKGNARGEVYVFEKPAGGWSGTINESARLLASNGAINDFFGSSVAISGDTIAVGAYEKTTSGIDNYQGAIYVFKKPGAGWQGTLTEDAMLMASDGARFDGLGTAVAIDQDVVIAGVYSKNSSRGQAYVFLPTASGWTGTLSENAILLPSDLIGNDWFGYSVSISGDTVLVTAPNQSTTRGAAYIFEKPLGGWSGTIGASARLNASDGATFDNFGYSASLSGDTAVIDAWGHHHGSFTGAVFVFSQPAAGWSGTLTESLELHAVAGLSDSVSLSGSTLAVNSGGKTRVYGTASPGGGDGDDVPSAPTPQKPTAKAKVTAPPKLQWKASSGASSYRVVVRKRQAKGKIVIDKTVSATKFKTTGLAKNKYFWQVQACNDNGCSAWSASRYFQITKK
jgi:hypothetical protein